MLHNQRPTPLPWLVFTLTPCCSILAEVYDQRVRPNQRARRVGDTAAPMKPSITFLSIAAGSLTAWAGALAVTNDAASPHRPGWQHCSALSGDNAARLSCFDQWAAQQATAHSACATNYAHTRRAASPPPVVITMVAPAAHDCHPSSRNCHAAGSWKPAATAAPSASVATSPSGLSVIGSNSVNTQPDSVLRQTTVPPAARPSTPPRHASSSRFAPKSPRAC